MSTKYESFMPAIYAEMDKTLLTFVKPGSKILDIGSYEGNLEDYLENMGGQFEIDCVDLDSKALDVLRAKNYKNIVINATEMDANRYLEDYKGSADVILSSASIHEINDTRDQKGYLEHLFQRLCQILNPGGIVIIGDLYFPDHVSDEVVEQFRLYQIETINHSNSRDAFLKPELIDDTASRNGFSVVLKKEIRAVKEIDRRYYVIVLKKN